jgi:hypothetical protein
MVFRSIRRLYQIGDLYFVRLLLITWLAIAVDPRISYGQSEMPEFTGQRLMFSGVDSAAWQSLPPLIADLEQSGHETTTSSLSNPVAAAPRPLKNTPIACMNTGSNRRREQYCLSHATLCTRRARHPESTTFSESRSDAILGLWFGWRDD